MELTQELQRMKTNHKLMEQQWANKEYDYKKRIQQLETKVLGLAMKNYASPITYCHINSSTSFCSIHLVP